MLRDDLREMVHEQLDFRELLYQLTARDLLLRYKQTAMGFAWAVLMPLMNTAIFSVVFMRVAPVQTRVPYPLFAFCGLLVWNFTASALRFSVTSLTTNTNLFDVFLTVWMFASAVVYPVDGIGGWAGALIRANPMTGIVEAYRSVLLYGTTPEPIAFGWTTALTLILLPAAWLLFHRCEFRFAENI